MANQSTLRHTWKDYFLNYPGNDDGNANMKDYEEVFKNVELSYRVGEMQEEENSIFFEVTRETSYNKSPSYSN